MGVATCTWVRVTEAPTLVVVVTVVVTLETGDVPGTPGVTTTGRFVDVANGVGRTGCNPGGLVATESARMTRRGTAEVAGVGATGCARSSKATTHSSVEI